jgi:hypothetical protein
VQLLILLVEPLDPGIKLDHRHRRLPMLRGRATLGGLARGVDHHDSRDIRNLLLRRWPHVLFFFFHLVLLSLGLDD